MTTFVLVPGTYQGAWCWSRLAPLLRTAGADVYPLTLTGVGDRAHLLRPDVGLQTHVDDVVAAIEAEELDDVVLVGHSAGGRVVSGAACAIPERIGCVMYLDSSNLELGAPRKQQTFVPRTIDVGPLRVPCFEPWANVERWGITDPETAAWVRRRCTPHPAKVYSDHLDLDVSVIESLSPVYIAFTEDVPDRVSPYGVREWVKARPAFRYRELFGPHDMMITDAPAVAREMLACV